MVCAVLVGLALFLTSSRQVVLASHDATVRPNFTGEAVVYTGPVLPDVRLPAGGRIGVDIRLGKSDAASTDELVERYALIASQPEGQIAKVSAAVQDMALDAALRGAVIGLVPIGVWLLVGRSRRAEIRARLRPPHAVIAVGVVVLLGLALWQPWSTGDDDMEDEEDWVSLADFLGPDVPLPDDAEDIEVRGDVTTDQTHRLIESAVDTYDKSKTFYAEAADEAAGLSLREPQEGETVVAFVSDRHDNIGMDPVARAVADAAGATAVFDGGDDTSAGKSWEAFSLDSVSAAFAGLDRWGVAGNHDHGDFVHDYLADHGWTMLDGEVVDGPGDTTLLGVDDPRSSGLGSWRDETGLSFTDVEDRIADAACAADERVTTILVHDANLGREALDRGCTDLVLGGHLHVRVGPTRVVGENGQAGYSYTTGTTGGAAYAIALGSKPRRDADISLITYADGRPTGIQWVTLRTNGDYAIGSWVPLSLTPAE
ncbi:metallophosphoesterase [Nocardioides mangrovi]|uniref:Metallophosphoesterase n=1 Tax=Nocardioides mangrovi TaxID=2874580 RepID=A0ABS7UCJ2_9ACTN|nr:metallophosphoesterase [Nocardioides mangrovi]MBZ5738569.1 metallophosphoesterase [Nocardioides mangrovi]